MISRRSLLKGFALAPIAAAIPSALSADPLPSIQEIIEDDMRQRWAKAGDALYRGVPTSNPSYMRISERSYQQLQRFWND